MKLFSGAKCHERATLRKLSRQTGNSSLLSTKIVTAVAHDQNAQLKVAWCCRLGKSARFSKLNLLLESQCFPRLRLGKHSNSWKTKFTVPLGTSYKVPVKIYLILTAGVTHLQCYSIVTLTLVTKSFPIGSVKFS